MTLSDLTARRRLSTIVVPFWLVSALFAAPTRGGEPLTYWNGRSGGFADWSLGSNWSPTGQPQYGQVVFNDTHVNGTTAYNDISGESQNYLGFQTTSVATPTFTVSTVTNNGLSLYDYGGTQAKIENQGSGTGVIDLPVTFAATSGNRVGEINAVNGDLTFTARGTVDLSGSVVDGLQMYGNGRTVTFDGMISGASKYVQVNGTNTIVLNAANTYSGSTNIYGGGTVRANGGAVARTMSPATSATGMGNVSVSTPTSGGTGALGGTGNISGTVTVYSGGTITAGADAATTGTLTTGVQAWNAGGTFLAKFAAGNTANDHLSMSGLTVPTAAGSFTVNLQGASLATAAGTYVLAVDTTRDSASSPNAFGPSRAAATLQALTLQVNGVTASAGYKLGVQPDASFASTGEYDLVVSAAPEPTSLVLAGVAAAPLLARRRRATRR